MRETPPERFASGEHRIRFGTVRSPMTDRIARDLARARDLPRVIRRRDLAEHDSTRFVNQVITAPDNSTLTTMTAFLEYIPPGARSNKHAHMNEAFFYILEGRGYDIHDGERIDWQAGDSVLVPPGVTHQHFNASETDPVLALVINPKYLYLNLHLNHQRLFETPYNPAHPHEFRRIEDGELPED